MQSAHAIGLSTLAIGAVVAAICVLVALDRLALWMESRGWIYYRRRKASTSALGNAFLEVQALVEPGQRLVLEARREDRVEDHESGDPPDPVPGAGDRRVRKPGREKTDTLVRASSPRRSTRWPRLP